MIKMLELITTMLVTAIVVITILRWLFGKGKKNVREQQVLELYQKALLNANQLSARSKAAAEEAIDLEETPVGAGGEVENPVNPVDILPAEMWAAVLDQLKDWNDLKSCCDTCRLFRDLLEGTKNEWLFKGVFPIIQRHHENLEATQLLKCRQICKAWKEEVDYALSHPVYIHVSQDGRARTRQKWQDMINHGGSPFVGCDVEIAVLQRGNGDLVEDLEGNPVEDLERAAAVEDIHYFINGLGKHLTGICLSVTSHLCQSSVLCHLLLCILSRCQSLKMLDIHDVMIFQRLDYLSEPEMDALTPQDFRLGPNFQSLAVGMLYGFWPIQNRILQHCAGQLKKLEAMELWTPNFEMSALEELKIILCFDSMWEATNGNVLKDLMQLRAPRLKKLSFPLNTVQCSLQNLLTLTKHFSTIEHLSLEWTENKIGFSKDQLVAVPEGLEPPPSLKTMQFHIISQFNDEMNADFLMLFPLLETLRLSRGNSGENTDKGFIVQLSSHWMQEARVYESNVWELLPFLKMVMVSQDFFTFEDYDTTCDAVYSRNKYNALKSKSNLAK